MNENIDLTKILKDCPQGWQFWSSVYGEVEFIGIYADSLQHKIRPRKDEWLGQEVHAYKHPILFEQDGFEHRVASGGEMIKGYGECTLFPSREQRDWSKFTAPWYNKEMDTIARIEKQGKPKPCSGVSFKYNGHIWDMCGRYNGVEILVDGEIKERIFLDNKPRGKSALEAIKEEKVDNEPKFKVGDKIINNLRICTILEITNDKYIFTDGSYLFISNQDSWDLVPGKEERFDPNTLKPFDKVLVRDDETCIWKADFYSHKGENRTHPFKCVSLIYKCCIPYNDETKHLVGTNEDAPDYYRYWED